MKPSLFTLLIIAITPAWASPPGAGAGAFVPPSSIASPCDSVNPTPFAGEMVILDVSVEGGGNTATVAANDSFTVSIDYHIQVCDTPGVNFCQVVVGYAASPAPLFCIFRDRVDCTGLNGSMSFKMKAPAFPSEYIIAFDLGRTVTEPPCPTAWPRGTPVAERYIACVTVVSGNIPIPLTGIADNVTATSATLHGTVNPSGASTVARFVYGTAPSSYTDSVTAFESPVTGSVPLAVSGSPAGLSGNTRYYYRLTAESENGYNTGGEASFFTGPQFTLAEAVHEFGHFALNGSRTDSIGVHNTGNMTLQITSVVSLSGQYSVSPLSATIPPAGVKKFAVTFSPPAYGAYNSGIVFLNGAATSPDTQIVRGDVPIGGVGTGWNIVSVPLDVADRRKSVVFPAALSAAFEFSDGYYPRDTLAYGRGYWLKFPNADSMVVAGSVRENGTAAVQEGWNMIGGPSLVVPLDSVTSVPPGILVGNFWEYAAGYSAVTQLRPGKGYWVKVTQAGTLTLKGTASAAEAAAAPLPAPEGFTALSVTDALGATQTLYIMPPGSGSGAASLQLPPPPPGGGFDARFEGDFFAAAPGSEGRDLGVRISGARYPVTLSWSAAPEGTALAAGARVLPMESPGSALLLSAKERAAVRSTARGAAAFGRQPAGRLTGSYPNPFNPSTRIDYTLRSAGRVRIAVYNTLGEEVAILVDAVRDAGEHTVAFEAGGLPGGVYFCRLEGAGEVSTIKLVMLK